MIKRILWIVLTVTIVFCVCGCAVTTVDKMYQVPKRSRDFNDLQSAIDKSMADLNYSAPLAGENRQNVQMADLDGDGVEEYLLFTKDNKEKSLRILAFQELNGSYVNVDTVQINGAAFDQVEYVNMDSAGGLEVIVGHQLSNQLIRSASVYTFSEGSLVQLASVNYTKLLTTDLDSDGLNELFILRSGEGETDNGVVELYSMKNGAVERFNETVMSGPVQKLKRLIVGKLDGGKAAVYAASSLDDKTLITDIYTVLENRLVNITLSNDSGNSIQTMRNFYVYADDIDSDGVIELPSLINMHPMPGVVGTDIHQLIRWYAMTPSGEKVEKMYTYHNFVGGWYLQIDSDIAQRLVVVTQNQQNEIFIWDKNYSSIARLMTIYTYTGQNREELGASENRFILHKTDSVVYAAKLESLAEKYSITKESAVYSFRLIHQQWKTGET